MRTDKGWPVHCGIISNIFTIYYFTISIFIKKMAQTDKGWPEAVSITDTEIIDQFYIQLQCLQKLFNQKTKQWNITVTKGFVSNTTIWSVSNLLCLSFEMNILIFFGQPPYGLICSFHLESYPLEIHNEEIHFEIYDQYLKRFTSNIVGILNETDKK